MSKTYFIELKPLNSFYFGSIKEFGNQNEEYYLKSGKYPQQTAVLGMLRKKILEDNGILKPHSQRDKAHRAKEKEYIGEIDEDFSKSSFGVIENLTTVQIYSEKTPYIFSYGEKGTNSEKSFTEDKILTNKGEKKLYNCDAKVFKEHIISIEKPSEKMEIFKNSVEIGINSFKRKNYSDEDKAFFKKERYKFATSKIYFGFYLTLNDGVKLENGIVQLGDKHSLFSMKVREEIEKKIDVKDIFDVKNAVFFLSDFYLESSDLDKILNLSQGVLLKNNKFKFITRDENNEKKQGQVQNLVGRGAIVILDSEKKILEILNDKKYENYKKIGLNNFVGGER